MAKAYDADFHIFHAMILHDDDPHSPAYYFIDIGAIKQSMETTGHEKMDSLLAAYHTNGVRVVKSLEIARSAAPAILEYAKENDIDLIVMGTHGRRGIGHVLLGSVAEEVVRCSGCPVLTIRERKEPRMLERIGQILVPIDFSDFSRRALVSAQKLAGEFGASLQLLHVVEQSIHPSFYITGKSSIFDLDPEIKEKSVDAMKQMVEAMGQTDVKVDYFVSEGKAAQEIASFSEAHDSGLIVISTHGLTGIEHFLVGSVTEKVVRLANCPVLTVKAFGKMLA
jgi:nucleotide-binding universal stress UspA family protein